MSSPEIDPHQQLLGNRPVAGTAEIVRRAPLNRDRVLRAAVALADDSGIEALSMRNLAAELGVVPMALYKHVANKEELLDGMVEVIVGEIDPPMPAADWKIAIRQRILSARQALLRHPWASNVIESRTNAPPVVLDYMDSLIGMFRAGGFSVDLTHHVMHALGSRMWGFTQEVFPTPPPPADPDTRAAMFRQVAARWPYIIEVATLGSHDEGSAVGRGCDDQFEFEFALDALLDGFERLHVQGWSSTHARRGAPDAKPSIAEARYLAVRRQAERAARRPT
jgi:AcrR family transcriptional regulator